MQAIFCYWDAISRNIVIAHSLKSLKDVPMRRPDTHFVRVLSRLMSKNILKALITELYTIKVDICHPGAISHDKSDRPFCKKSPGRPYETSCYIFVTVLSRITSPNLPKTLNHIQYRLLFVTGGNITQYK